MFLRRSDVRRLFFGCVMFLPLLRFAYLGSGLLPRHDRQRNCEDLVVSILNQLLGGVDQIVDEPERRAREIL